MSKTVKLRKGLDIRLVGVANKIKSEFVTPKSVSIRPADFHGMTPKMLLKEGASVRMGEAVLPCAWSSHVRLLQGLSIRCVQP